LMSNRDKKISKLQAGIGLIELLISMVIGLFIMAGVLQLFSTSSQNAVAVTGSSRIQENVRYAFARIAEDIAQSGNLGCISSSVAERYPDKQPITNMLTPSGDAYDFLTIANGDNGTGSGTSGDTETIAPGTDRFRIRYVNNTVRFDVTAITATSVTVTGNDLDSLPQGRIVALSNCFEGAIFSITNVPADDAGDIFHTTSATNIKVPNATTEKGINLPARINNGATNVVSPFYLYAGSTGSYEYTIRQSAGASEPCNRVATSTSGPENCALYRSESGTALELVQGAHDIQVEYGWTDPAGSLSF
jgi:type IV pilus assembly protein PilW